MIIKQNRFLDQILKEVSARKGISFSRVQECVASEFEFIRRRIETFDRETLEGARSIYIPRFGKFIISDNKFEFLKSKLNKEEDETI